MSKHPTFPNKKKVVSSIDCYLRVDSWRKRIHYFYRMSFPNQQFFKGELTLTAKIAGQTKNTRTLQDASHLRVKL